MSHAFVSYVRDDQELIGRLARALEEAGIEVWLDRLRIKPGMRWQVAITHAIQEGAFFIACFSQAYATRESTYMNEELDLALEQLPLRPRDRVWFIPVVLNGGKIPDRSIGAGDNLRDVQWVDLNADWREGINKLVSMILEIGAVNGAESLPERRERARGWKRSERLAAQLTDPTASVEDRNYAATTLRSIAPQATQAIRALQQALADGDESVRMAAVRALVDMGEAAASVVVDAVASPFPPIRDAALLGLKALGPRLAHLTDSLIELLPRVPESTGSLAVSDVLASIGDAAVDALLATMASRNSERVGGAASALRKMDPPAARCASTMKGWLRDPDHVLRAAATGVVANLTGRAKNLDWTDAVMPLAEAIREPELREQAYVALRNLGPAATAAVPILIDILREPVDAPLKSGNNHDLAQTALANIGPAAVPALIELLCDRTPIEDPEARYIGLKARYDGLWALGWIHNDEALKFMRERAADPHEHIWLRAHAAAYLSTEDARKPAHMAVLTEAAWPSATHWDAVSIHAIEVLADYREEAESVAKLMIEILASESSDYVKEAAAKTLANLGPPSAATFSAVRALRERGDSTGRIVAAVALERWELDADSDGRATGAQR